jgi:hypothetical protein
MTTPKSLDLVRSAAAASNSALVMWRGLSRLTDIALGSELAKAAPRCG